ncbi:hypothetical protein IP65_14805 [Novosphingobium sp. AAP1]|nr:hypothetical protein IP65_14805 [Novosphingobium sp. AAP1]
MIRASGADRAGSSAKVQPPRARVRNAAGSAARPGVPGDVIRIATQPLPHQASAIDTAQPRISGALAPRPQQRHGLKPTKCAATCMVRSPRALLGNFRR